MRYCFATLSTGAKQSATLAVKLAKEAILGDTVLKKFTISGERGFPALPQKELLDLKHNVFQKFPHYWQAPLDFELQWKSCCECIGQASKRLKDKDKGIGAIP